MKFHEHRLTAQDVKSLCWQGDVLIDWVAGGKRYHLDGSIQDSHVRYAYRFDMATISPSGRYSAIYEKLGTKSLLLDNGKVIRELNRSFYYANAYEYPIALFYLPDGREAIAHCPERYNRLEIEDLATGERLTNNSDRKPRDYFISRLAATGNGKFLLTAGWLWHPMDQITIYDVEAALTDPRTLDSRGIGIELISDNNCAAFTENGKVILTECSEVEEYEKEEDEIPIRVRVSNSLKVFDLISRNQLSTIELEDRVGTIMPISSNLVVGFFEYPKLIDIEQGKIIHRWPSLKTGKQTSSIIWGIERLPPLALDPANHRFAVATETEIEIVQIEP